MDKEIERRFGVYSDQISKFAIAFNYLDDRVKKLEKVLACLKSSLSEEDDDKENEE